jgi:hypothetical protein
VEAPGSFGREARQNGKIRTWEYPAHAAPEQNGEIPREISFRVVFKSSFGRTAVCKIHRLASGSVFVFSHHSKAPVVVEGHCRPRLTWSKNVPQQRWKNIPRLNPNWFWATQKFVCVCVARRTPGSVRRKKVGSKARNDKIWVSRSGAVPTIVIVPKVYISAWWFGSFWY